MAITYRDAGVDIEAGEQLVERIRPLAESTRRPEVIAGVGGFAGLCALPGRYRQPVLVSGTDGVGTKLAVAQAAGRHRGVGVDLVAMCVNDVITVGAEPLLFLDYFAASRLEVETAAEVMAGIAEGCREAGCALLGGETAEMPGLYQGSDYDLAGFCVGVVERDEIISGERIGAGDAVLGLASSGIHSNGLSLARRALLEELELELDARPEILAGASVADALLTPTRIYARELAALAAAGIQIRGAAHITGGGLIENPPRMLAGEALAVELDPRSWPVPPIFDLIASAGVEESEMRRTFNLGLGMLIVVAEADVEAALAALGDAALAAPVGHIRARAGDPVVFRS
jgi:phosphoribosylformylglycinamidine cyclo-ligase